MLRTPFKTLCKCDWEIPARRASPRSVATRRGKKVTDLMGKRDTPAGVVQEGADV